MSSIYTSSNISKEHLPSHVAIIMDGNGRWAKARGLPRTAGHKQGIESVRRAVKAAVELNIPYLTLFGFSCENWSRPEAEIKELMRLLRYYLKSETAEFHRSNVSLKVIGDRTQLDDDIVKLIENAEKLTQDNTGLNLVIALNYGGRQEIVQAISTICATYVEKGNAPDSLEIETILPDHLSTGRMPDPDLLIRTSGEKRISNFLLWQCAYAEFVFLDVLWPDFTKSDFEDALLDYKNRDRRFGSVKKNQR